MRLLVLAMECLREYALRENYLIERGSIESLEVGEDWGPFCGVAVCTLCKILPCERAYATEIFLLGVARQATCNARYQSEAA
jgi:hypothetical protein